MKVLQDNWHQVFPKLHTNRGITQRWLEEDASAKDSPQYFDQSSWEICRHHLEQGIAWSPTTAPGPDGIPFVAWRGLGPLAVDIMTCAPRPRRRQPVERDGAAVCSRVWVLQPQLSDQHSEEPPWFGRLWLDVFPAGRCRGQPNFVERRSDCIGNAIGLHETYSEGF